MSHPRDLRPPLLAALALLAGVAASGHVLDRPLPRTAQAALARSAAPPRAAAPVALARAVFADG